MLATFSDERSALTIADPEWLERLFATVVSSAVSIATRQSMVTVSLDPPDGSAAPELRVTACVQTASFTIPQLAGDSVDFEELVTACEREAPSVGLRLALADAIARRYGGGVWVASAQDVPFEVRFAITLRACLLAHA